MPRKNPPYPTVEPSACNLTDEQIASHIEDLQSQSPGVNFTDGGSPDVLCRALNVDIEYSGLPNDILLDVAIDKRPVIWLPRRSKSRQDRMMVAVALGFWIIHVPLTREAHPNCGIQALYDPADASALKEALRFGQTLLMPEDMFKSLWYEGRAQLVADTLNVPTQSVYDRAKGLMLTNEQEEPEAAPEVAREQTAASNPAAQAQNKDSELGTYA